MYSNPSGCSAILVIGLLVGSFIVGVGARNSVNIASSMKLTGKRTSAVKAITTASNRYLAREISMKGLQATTRLWGNVALDAVQDALAPTIRSLMINGAITIARVTIGTVAVNYGLSYLIQLFIIIVSTILFFINQFVISFILSIVFMIIGYDTLGLHVIYELVLVFLSRGLGL